MKVNKAVVQKVLDAHSTKKYNIYSDGKFAHNHLAHGVVALYHLDASEDKLWKFAETDGEAQIPPMDHEKEPFDNVENVRGKKTCYVTLREHYAALLKKHGSLEKLIQVEYPKISGGMVGGALHGIIHIGYGYSVGSEIVVCEGFALSDHDFDKFHYDLDLPQNSIAHFGKGSQNILSVLEAVAQDTEFEKLIFQKFKEGYEKKLYLSEDPGAAGFYYRARVLNTLTGNKILEYVNKIKAPDPNDGDDMAARVKQLMDWVVNCAVFVYTKSDRVNDFFLLHGITGSWSLREIITLLKPEDALQSIRDFVCALLVVYLIQQSPSLSQNIVQAVEVNQSVWDSIKGDAITKKFMDHHVLKLVQVFIRIYRLVWVCYLMWKTGKYPDMAAAYVQASRICVDNLYATDGFKWPVTE